jgi:hypothetical protein
VTEKAYLDLDDEDLRQNYISYSPLERIKKNRRKYNILTKEPCQ